MDRLFLDANVLFSAAYRDDAGIARLWGVRTATLLTSKYAITEARRNLSEEAQRERLDRLLESVQVGAGASAEVRSRDDIDLREKDWPILGGAVAAGATHLITGDVRDFGKYFGTRLMGILILPPAEYLRSVS